MKYKKKFKNELNNNIVIKTEEVEDQSGDSSFDAVKITIEGPESISENTITYMEANNMAESLVDFLEDKGVLRSKVVKRVRARKIRHYYNHCIEKLGYDQQVFSLNNLIFDVSLIWDQAQNKSSKLIPISDFEEHFVDKNWNSDGIKVSINDLLNRPKEYIEHYRGLEGVLLDHPIIIWKERLLDETGSDSFEMHIVDGLHRLAKCKLNDIKSVEVIFLNNKEMKDCLLDNLKVKDFNSLLKTNLDFSEVFLDSPIGSKKGFGGKKRELPFDYGEFSNFINPADDMGWDIIVVPSQSGAKIKQKIHNYVIVGIVKINEDKLEWETNANKQPPYGNHKVIVAEFAEYSEEDKKIINNFFKNMWQFKKPEFFEV